MCLNKVICASYNGFLVLKSFFALQLDAGTDERVMLVSRDEQACLVVSYKEVKSCIQSAFRYASSPSLLIGRAHLICCK